MPMQMHMQVKCATASSQGGSTRGWCRAESRLLASFGGVAEEGSNASIKSVGFIKEPQGGLLIPRLNIKNPYQGPAIDLEGPFLIQLPHDGSVLYIFSGLVLYLAHRVIRYLSQAPSRWRRSSIRRLITPRRRSDCCISIFRGRMLP